MGKVRRVDSARDAFGGQLALARQRVDRGLRECEACLIGLPAEIGVGDRAGQQQGGGTAFGFGRARIVDCGRDRGAGLAPEIEVVLEFEAEVAQVVPGET
jgi:hypothetical protein